LRSKTQKPIKRIKPLETREATLPMIIISVKDNSFFIPNPRVNPNIPKPNRTISPCRGPAKIVTKIPDIKVAIMANFMLWRKHKIIIGRGHKKLTSVPNRGMKILIINKTAVIAAKNAPSTIDLVGICSVNKQASSFVLKKV